MYEQKIHDVYYDARNRAKKAYNQNKALGLSGHLPSLDGVLKDIEVVGTSYLGVFEIELDQVVGTYYHSRRMTFSNNFLPLESEHSEFATKWMSLCAAHLNEGIRDAIKVYEYLNHYYVVEGNKRVSVLKYYEAYKVSAEVTRLIPKYDPEDENIVLYYAFLEFFNKTKLLEVRMSKPLRYKRLLKYLDQFSIDDNELVDKYQYFLREIFNPFKRIYIENGGEALSITFGDAFLLYAKLYGLESALNLAHVREVMPNLIKEYMRLGDQEEAEIITDTDDVERVAFFDAVSSFLAPKKIKVGFVYARTIESSGWTYSHELGRRYLESVFPGRVETGFIENVPEDQTAYDYIRDFANEGYDAIFTTSEIYRRPTIKCAVEMPKVKFFNCSGNRPYVHMTNYFGRTYEPRFLSGMIAGAMTKSNIVGYTATEPNPEVLSSINAFALGMKMMNPHSKLLVTWTGEWNNPQKTTDMSVKLVERGADLISNKTLLVPRDVTLEYGVYSMLCDIDPVTKKPKHYLASPIWKWGKFYEKIVFSLLNGSYQRMTMDGTEGQKLINFWWGMESDAVDLYASEEYVPRGTLQLVKLMKKMIISEQFHPFTGPIKDSDGVLRVEKDAVLSTQEILNMDWLIECVEVID